MTGTLAERKRPPRMTYSHDLQNKIDQLIASQHNLAVEIAELRSSIMSRPEIEADLEKRITIATHIADLTNVDKRLSRLEEAPMGNWTRAGIAISGSIGCLGLLLSAASVIVALFAMRII